ncbi:hypothetical protein [Candidatus Tisiphia endosymbiont of Beris chalybata]|uniref:hypothetical protein n=1 Tax=Candidatus Tisiphia endosymbiont of Beris chalybata TaxID=3066262 RepID=UPI00312C6EFB
MVLELLPLVIVLIAAFVCLVSIVVTVVKIVYDYCNEINEEDPAPEESEIPALSSHSPDYETVEIEAEESKKLTGEIRKEYNADSSTSGGE